MCDAAESGLWVVGADGPAIPVTSSVNRTHVVGLGVVACW